MSVRDVKDTAARVILNNTATLDGAKTVVKSAGKMSPDELKAFEDSFNKPGLRLDADTQNFIRETAGEVRQLHRTKDQMNADVKRDAPRLQAAEEMRMALGVETKSFGGTVIPEAVKKIVSGAIAAGATVYDVREVEDPELDEAHGGWQLPGKWTPYPQECGARGTMAFSNTEITPAKIKKDMETVQKYLQIDGYSQEKVNLPVAGGQPQTIQVPKYKQVEGKGTGNITAHYDESRHREMNARGSSGQIWANNFAILSDGSLHCVPAMRRNEYSPNLILTNPSLARGERMLANGHIEMRAGVIVSIGISGRLQNRVNDGEAKLADPVAILKAWGFNVAPNCEVRFEGNGAQPRLDPNTHVFG